MLKRIHSNRDPKDTLFSELRKEFSSAFQKLSDKSTALLNRRPKLTFGLMCFLLLGSFVLSITVFRAPAEKKAPATVPVSPLDNGFGQIMDLTGKLQTTIRYKRLVDSLSVKQKLSSGDSTALNGALDSLKKLNP
ncbi:hypothetical protein [Mucilaginibacter sp. SJ]|uniref:hypothetical protein n=1 Tax=Mucilaginibacter sp. SJ TaxID=3029053 RepID=UPI0023A951C1|nr:hypothetical protein [Mucilaginibacter sp. SJ]WEA01722.1 hypothetical protein MusilaSJ_02150 [Mucilaginibacter sp. SJ]